MTSSYLRTEQRVNSRGANILGEEEARLIFNHRPETVAALPASLVYPGFGRFIDGLKPGAVSLTKEDYEAAATLCSVGHRLFVDQGARGDALNKVLSDYLGKTIRQTEVEACKQHLFVITSCRILLEDGSGLARAQESILCYSFRNKERHLVLCSCLSAIHLIWFFTQLEQRSLSRLVHFPNRSCVAGISACRCGPHFHWIRCLFG